MRVCFFFKFCYKPVGHVITGNFDIIKDNRLRTLLTKGPKYRMPSFIDFDSCRSLIAESIQEFSVKWCRREHADECALSDWKKKIFDIIDTHIAFYKSNSHLLPPKPRVTHRFLKQAISNFHSNYVLAPADKASNNVIII